MPHKDIFDNIKRGSSFLQDDTQIFQHDFSFIEKINDVNSKSPWKAKAHDHFSNQT